MAVLVVSWASTEIAGTITSIIEIKDKKDIRDVIKNLPCAKSWRIFICRYYEYNINLLIPLINTVPYEDVLVYKNKEEQYAVYGCDV